MSHGSKIETQSIFLIKAKTSHRQHTAGKIDCNTESSYKKFQACLITYNKVVRVFVSMPWGY